jgi:hypothetical protein
LGGDTSTSASRRSLGLPRNPLDVIGTLTTRRPQLRHPLSRIDRRADATGAGRVGPVDRSQNADLTVHNIAREERLTAAYIYTLLRLPGLAPDITTAIVNGRPTTTTQRQNVNAQGFAASRRLN